MFVLFGFWWRTLYILFWLNNIIQMIDEALFFFKLKIILGFIYHLN